MGSQGSCLYAAGFCYVKSQLHLLSGVRTPNYPADWLWVDFALSLKLKFIFKEISQK